MKKIVRLTENDLTRLVKKILNEGIKPTFDFDTFIYEHIPGRVSTTLNMDKEQLKNSGFYKITVGDNSIYFEPVTADGNKKQTTSGGFFLESNTNCSRSEDMVPNTHYQDISRTISKFIQRNKNKPFDEIYSLDIVYYYNEFYIDGLLNGGYVPALKLIAKGNSIDITIMPNCMSKMLSDSLKTYKSYRKELKNVTKNLYNIDNLPSLY